MILSRNLYCKPLDKAIQEDFHIKELAKLLVERVIKNKKRSGFSERSKLNFVDPQGFEPRQAVPKTEVLPLHHGSVVYCGANLGLFF